MTPDQALKLAAAMMGGTQQLCDKLNVSRQAMYGWKKQIPLKRALQIEDITGIPFTKLRPDYADQSHTEKQSPAS
jgi:hypothetical protein